MHVVVVGASGTIGTRVVHAALERGHRVTALVRDPARFTAPAGVEVQQADVLCEDTPLPLPADADAVVFAVGSRGTGSTVVRSEGLAKVLAALPPAGPRLVALSGTSVAISRRVSLIRRLALRFLIQKRLRNVLNDMERMEDELRRSDADWTVVRCTSVRERGTGLSVSEAGQERRHKAVGVDELARWVLDCSTEPGLRRTAVALAGTS